MDARLVVEQGGPRGAWYRLRDAETIVGRQKGCDLRIPSGEVSRRHCRFFIADEVLYLEDLDSANGTFLNGDPVRGTPVVHPGDRVRIGPVVFVVEYEMTQDVIDELRRKTKSRGPQRPTAAEPPARPRPASRRRPAAEEDEDVDTHLPTGDLRDLLEGLEDGEGE